MPAWLNLPNAITLLRLILTPFVIQAIVGRRPACAMALFIAASVTDVLDGAAARRLRVVTSSGAYFDPVADKCLLSGVFLALAIAHFVPWWFVAIVFGRDICILAGVGIFFLFTSIRSFPPSIWGKLSTFVQISTVVVWMARNMLEIPVIDALAAIMLWVSIAVTIGSGLDYARRGLQLARAH
ncbi:MAG TPA: CDP-alcohol phosphatidyltransferase family protein [Candidatus Sulfopaludibacter sp.]|nr:CDP-alcohol phosphatidyltransferase family protein [Candidatus Sulfopaludibacter sp.]